MREEMFPIEKNVFEFSSILVGKIVNEFESHKQVVIVTTVSYIS